MSCICVCACVRLCVRTFILIIKIVSVVIIDRVRWVPFTGPLSSHGNSGYNVCTVLLPGAANKCWNNM